MKVQVKRIGPEGTDFQESFPVDILGIAQTDVLRFVEPFDTKVKVTIAEDEVIAACASTSHYVSFCSRCLEEVEQDWIAEFSISFDAKEYAEFIEMDEDIRQEIILNLPVRILCRADCKGLCIDCGANLNKKECKHHHAVAVDQ